MAKDEILTDPNDIETALKHTQPNGNLKALLDKLGLKDYSGLDFSKAAASEFGINEVKFTSTVFDNYAFIAADLSAVVFEAVTIQGCNFESCNANDAIFNFCTLSKSHFVNAAMERVQISSCDISGCRFANANLVSAKLLDLKQSVTNRVRHVDNKDKKELDLTVQELRQKNDVIVFRNSNLEGSNLSNSCFFGADFENAKLSGIDFTGTDLRYANLVGIDADIGLLNAELPHARMTRETANFFELQFCDTNNPNIVEIAHPPNRALMTA